MTLDCVCHSQSRVISLHSWYLTSFLFLSFYCLPHRRILRCKCHTFHKPFTPAFSPSLTFGAIIWNIFIKRISLRRTFLRTFSFGDFFTPYRLYIFIMTTSPQNRFYLLALPARRSLPWIPWKISEAYFPIGPYLLIWSAFLLHLYYSILF